MKFTEKEMKAILKTSAKDVEEDRKKIEKLLDNATEANEIKKKKTDHPIVLRPNNTLSNDPCALCGGRCDPVGLDYMLDGTSALVCEVCAKKYAPDLVAAYKQALAAAYRAGAEGEEEF